MGNILTISIYNYLSGKLVALLSMFDLSQNDSQIFGTSRIELGDYYAVMKLSGSISDGVISYNDSSFLEKNEASDWYFVLGKADLNFVNTSPPVLEGPWTGPGNCWPGSIFLIKQ